MKFSAALLLTISLGSAHGLSIAKPARCGKLSKCHVLDLDSGDKLELKDMTMDMRKRRNIRCSDAALDLDDRVLHAEVELNEFTRYTIVCEATGIKSLKSMHYVKNEFSDKVTVSGKKNMFYPFDLEKDGSPKVLPYINKEGNKDIRISGYIDGRKDACFETQIVLDTKKGSSPCDDSMKKDVKYHIASKANGLALNVHGGSTKDGADIIQWTLDKKADNDDWIFEPKSGGYYHIVNDRSKKVLHMDPSKNIVQYKALSKPKDDWCLVKRGKYYQIRNRETKLCIDFKTEGKGKSAVALECDKDHLYKVTPIIGTRSGDGKPITAPPPAPKKTSAPTRSPVSKHTKAAGACSLRGNTLSWSATVRAGLTVSANFGANNARVIYYETKGTKSITVNSALFNGHRTGTNSGFYMRFYDKEGDVAGPWSWCRNYNNVKSTTIDRNLNNIPADACYLWGYRFWYDTYVPAGSTVEVYTKDHKRFNYKTTHATLKYMTNTRARHDINLRGFKIKIKNSKTGQYAKTNPKHTDAEGWLKCRNFTPIAIDLDGDNAIKVITPASVGQDVFHVDITGDGQINELTEWFNNKDGILLDVETLDLEHDNQVGDNVQKIDGTHMFGDQGRQFDDGFDKLMEKDYNKDGLIQGEKELENLMLWVDGNSNCMVDDDELHTLQDHGIVAIRANTTTLKSEAIREDGTTLYVEDVMFHGERRRLRGSN